jgi:hypothetical protein
LILIFFPAPEECTRRIVKREDDDSEAELTVEEATLAETVGVIDPKTCVDVEMAMK